MTTFGSVWMSWKKKQFRMGEEAEAASADTEDRIVVTNAEAPLPEPEMPFYEEGENRR